MNDTVTIIIFIKELKCTQLATRIYEKDPHTLTDATKEVEKFHTAQLTATIIPASTVNMMSNEEDQCLQCQESDNIAGHCPHMQCYECDDYSHMVMDCLHKIPSSGRPAPHHEAHKSHNNRNHSED